LAEGTETSPARELLDRVHRLAQGALERYGLSKEATVTTINYSENITFRVEDPVSGVRTILRVHRVGYHSFEAIRSELSWMVALRREAGIETPEPIAAMDGSLIQTLHSPELAQPRHAVMFQFLHGHEPSEDNLRDSFERLGEITARMHLQAKAWRRPTWFVRHRWEYETMLGARPIWGRWQEGLGIDGARSRILERACVTIKRRLETYGTAADRFGLVHADLRLANLLIEGERTKVIDFDDCGFSWYLYDLGAALSFIEHRADVPELVEAWTAGYRKVADLAREQVAEIPTFIMLRRLLLVAWIGSHAETDLARQQGVPFTETTCHLAENYLRRFG
jgi:Ser/Thr protein kinase RdoA (MazF antagonist)